MTDGELIDRAQNIARRMTDNDDKTQAEAKHILSELCHRLGAKATRIHKKQDGLLLITVYGRTRYMTLSERVLYRLFGVVPPFKGWRGDGND